MRLYTTLCKFDLQLMPRFSRYGLRTLERADCRKLPNIDGDCFVNISDVNVPVLCLAPAPKNKKPFHPSAPESH